MARRRKVSLRRALAAWLLRLARRLVARKPPAIPQGAASAASDAPAHWLARLRPGARRLTIRTGVSAEATPAPPEPAPRASTAGRVAPLPVERATRPDWKVVVRNRARELAVKPVPSTPARQGLREERSPAQPPLEPSPPSRNAVELPKPDSVPPQREPSPPSRRSERSVIRKPVALAPIEQGGHASHTPHEPAAARVGVLQPVQVAAVEIAYERASARIVSASRERMTPEWPRRVEPAPVAPRAGRSEPAAGGPLEATYAPSTRRGSSVPATRTSSQRLAGLDGRATQASLAAPEQRPAHVPAQDTAWPSLPDEAGDVAPVAAGWPLPPAAGEWPSDETLEDRAAQAAHDDFLRAEQRGDRWNA